MREVHETYTGELLAGTIVAIASAEANMWGAWGAWRAAGRKPAVEAAIARCLTAGLRRAARLVHGAPGTAGVRKTPCEAKDTIRIRSLSSGLRNRRTESQAPLRPVADASGSARTPVWHCWPAASVVAARRQKGGEVHPTIERAIAAARPCLRRRCSDSAQPPPPNSQPPCPSPAPTEPAGREIRRPAGRPPPAPAPSGSPLPPAASSG